MEEKERVFTIASDSAAYTLTRNAYMVGWFDMTIYCHTTILKKYKNCTKTDISL